MRVQGIRNDSNMSFSALRRDNSTISKKMYDDILKMPVVDQFAKKFDAKVGLGYFYSSKDNYRQQLALTFSEIKPKSIIERVKNFLTGKSVNEIWLKTKADNEEDFLTYISNQHSNSLNKIYKDGKKASSK